MKHVFLESLLASSLVLAPMAATAQVAGDQIENQFYSPDQYRNTHSMFDKIRSDLYEAQTNAYPNYLGDNSRFEIAHNELNALEQNWDRGQYDSREFENTMTAVQMVLNDNRLMGHDRDVLSADVSRLLDFRAEYY
jgi:hypothetical protein